MKRDNLINNKPEGEYMSFIDDDDYVGNEQDKNNDDGYDFLRGCLVLIGVIAIVAAVIIGVCELV